MKSPKFLKLFLILPIYPLFYYMWVQQIKRTWLQNDIKDLHPEILFPQKDRYTIKNINIAQQFEDCLQKQISGGLRFEYEKRLKSGLGQL